MTSPMLFLAFVLLAPSAAGVDCPSMKTKELRVFLRDRGLRCDGCAEKADFVQMCEDNKDKPTIPPVDEASTKPPKDDKSIEELLASMKGMPGMEGIKMFTAA